MSMTVIFEHKSKFELKNRIEYLQVQWDIATANATLSKHLIVSWALKSGRLIKRRPLIIK